MRRNSRRRNPSFKTLQAELAETNCGLVALSIELEQRVEERTRELRSAHQELQQTNSEVLRAALELEAANRELEAFANAVSHDLRAPLRTINGFAQILYETSFQELNERGKHCLRRIERACLRMTSMIEDLLKLSRLTRSELRCETVDLSAIAAEIVGSLYEAEPGRRAEFSIAGRQRLKIWDRPARPVSAMID